MITVPRSSLVGKPAPHPANSRGQANPDLPPGPVNSDYWGPAGRDRTRTANFSSRCGSDESNRFPPSPDGTGNGDTNSSSH